MRDPSLSVPSLGAHIGLSLPTYTPPHTIKATSYMTTTPKPTRANR